MDCLTFSRSVTPRLYSSDRNSSVRVRAATIILFGYIRSEGAGNQCCYNKDGLLQYAADSYQGSTPDRSHSWGAAPYGKPNLVPDFSHWQHDVITFYYCCLWTNNRECDRYMERRPTRDCVDYKSPSYGK